MLKTTTGTLGSETRGEPVVRPFFDPVPGTETWTSLQAELSPGQERPSGRCADNCRRTNFDNVTSYCLTDFIHGHIVPLAFDSARAIAPKRAEFINKLYAQMNTEGNAREWNSEPERLRLKKSFVYSLSMTNAKQRVRDMRALHAYPLHVEDHDVLNGVRGRLSRREVDRGRLLSPSRFP
jgi:hypothetical protein